MSASPEAQHRIQVAEAEWSVSDRYEPLMGAIREQCGSAYCWIVDLFDSAVVYGCESGPNYEYHTYRCSYSIDDAGGVTLGSPEEVQRRTEYVSVAAAPESEAVAAMESLTGEIIPLREGAVRDDGTAYLKLIAPGWGSSGYYPADMLRRDGPTAFPAGTTKNFWDHPTLTEETDRPERSLRDVAGVLTTAAQFDENGPEGPGLYADAQVFDPYRTPVAEMAPYIGLSIRASGNARYGTAEGRDGLIIESLLASPHNSCDYVTVAGADGKVVSLFESARGGQFTKKGQNGTTSKAAVKETNMTEPNKEQPEVAELRETARRQEQEIARLRERAVLSEAREVVGAALSTIEMPGITRTRLAESLAQNPPTKDGELDREALSEAVKAAATRELEYLQAAGARLAGSVVGMGQYGTVSAEETDTVMESGFRAMGLSESAAKLAAAGRG